MAARLVKSCSVSITLTALLHQPILTLSFLSVRRLRCHAGRLSRFDQSPSGNGLAAAAPLRCRPFTTDPEARCSGASPRFGLRFIPLQRDSFLVVFICIYEILATRVCREDLFCFATLLHYRNHHKSVNSCHSAVTVCSINLNLLREVKARAFRT